MALIISAKVLAKLAAKIPPVARDEVIQCFANRTGLNLIDDREEHESDPPTQWFIAETDYGRKLKVAFILRDKNIHLRSAYDANQKWIKKYAEYHERGI